MAGKKVACVAHGTLRSQHAPGPLPTARLRVAVVGPCASGKTTLVARLRALGFDAHSVAQEHSEAPGLYRRMGADVLVYLDVSYDAVRRRRDVPWGPERLVEEARRLRFARAAADLVVDTDTRDADAVAREVLSFLATWRREAQDAPAARAQGPSGPDG